MVQCGRRDDRVVQGRSEDQRQLGDVQSWAGRLLPPGSVFTFLADHRRELFPDELFADLSLLAAAVNLARLAVLNLISTGSGSWAAAAA